MDESPINPDEDKYVQCLLLPPFFRQQRNESDLSLYRIFEKEGSKVVVDEGSFELIRGATVDFVQEMIRSSFAVVNNPQSESACGCGSSFAVKNFSSNPALD